MAWVQIHTLENTSHASLDKAWIFTMPLRSSIKSERLHLSYKEVARIKYANMHKVHGKHTYVSYSASTWGAFKKH